MILAVKSSVTGKVIGSFGRISMDLSPLNTRSTLIGKGIIGLFLRVSIRKTKFGLFLLVNSGGNTSMKKKKGAASYLKILNLLMGFIMITNAQ